MMCQLALPAAFLFPTRFHSFYASAPLLTWRRRRRRRRFAGFWFCGYEKELQLLPLCASAPLPVPLADRWGWAPHEIGVRASAKTDYSSRTCFDKQQFKTWCYFWFTPKTEYVTYTQYVYVIRPLLKRQPCHNKATTNVAHPKANKRLAAKNGRRESKGVEWGVASSCNFICLHI